MLPARLANIALGVLLALALVTGTLAFAIGTSWVRWVLAAHAAAALGLLVLIPVKQRVVRRGWKRHRTGRWASTVMGTLIVITVLSGLVLSAGWWPQGWPIDAVHIHVPAAIAGSALAVWHAIARPARVRRADANRRVLLRSAGVLALGGAAWLGAEGAWRALGTPGAARIATGSHRLVAGGPALLASGERTAVVPLAQVPSTIWFDDRVQRLDAAAWRLAIDDAGGVAQPGPRRARRARGAGRAPGLHQPVVRRRGVGRRAAGGAGRPGDARSIAVVSATGYARRFPVRDLPRLHLAVGSAGEPLGAGHGAPVRLGGAGSQGLGLGEVGRGRARRRRALVVADPLPADVSARGGFKSRRGVPTT